MSLLIWFSSFVLIFSFYCYGHHRDLHSFPTRRSSDLAAEDGLLRNHDLLIGGHDRHVDDMAVGEGVRALHVVGEGHLDAVPAEERAPRERDLWSRIVAAVVRREVGGDGDRDWKGGVVDVRQRR